jgi:hypothetical protein
VTVPGRINNHVFNSLFESLSVIKVVANRLAAVDPNAAHALEKRYDDRTLPAVCCLQSFWQILSQNPEYSFEWRIRTEFKISLVH